MQSHFLQMFPNIIINGPSGVQHRSFGSNQASGFEENGKQLHEAVMSWPCGCLKRVVWAQNLNFSKLEYIFWEGEWSPTQKVWFKLDQWLWRKGPKTAVANTKISWPWGCLKVAFWAQNLNSRHYVAQKAPVLVMRSRAFNLLTHCVIQILPKLSAGVINK